MTTEDFIKKAKEVHGDKYSYARTEYVNSTTNVSIECPVHGDFLQNPNSHLRGCGCRQCSFDVRRKEKHKLTEKEFIQRANDVFGGKYDYSNVEFIDEFSQVRVVCPIHGEFTVSPKHHLHGKGCMKCTNTVYDKNHKCDREQFIEKSKALYGDKFNYSKVVYRNSFEDVTLICSEHGEFNITPGNHLKIVGGASRLFKHFIKLHDPNEIVSYADRRWSMGKMYEILGFELYNKSKPNYHYVIGEQRRNRFNFRKSVLIEKYGCSPDMSEREFCKQQHWHRIYDCGCLCFKWKK